MVLPLRPGDLVAASVCVQGRGPPDRGVALGDAVYSPLFHFLRRGPRRRCRTNPESIRPGQYGGAPRSQGARQRR
jgi:hypothetical protein